MNCQRAKILFLAEEMAVNGAMKSLIALLEVLQGQGYDVSLFVSSHHGELHSQIPKYVKVLPENMAYCIVRLPLRVALRKALVAFRIDLVVMRLMVAVARKFKLPFPCWFMLPRIKGYYDLVCAYADGFVAQMAVRKVLTSKRALWIHCDYTQYKQSRQTFDAFKKADVAVSVSLDSIEKFNIACGEPISTPFAVVHNIIDVDEIRRKALAYSVPSCSEEIVKLVSVGRVTHQKGFDLAPEIARGVFANNIKLEWDVIGGATEEAMTAHKKLVDKAGMNGIVRFLGEMENPMPYVAAADIVVIPSRFEGWGMTLSEALVLGKPVVATDLPVFREQVTNGVNGILVSLDAKEFAEAIIKLLKDEELRRRLSHEALKYPFTKDTVVKEFGELFS